MERGIINIYRCDSCKRLVSDKALLAKGSCNCGSRKMHGASPINLLEEIKCLWWRIRYASL